MSVTINGTTGVSLVQDGVIVQDSLASGVASTGPLFRVKPSNSSQTINHDTLTKITWGTETYDTNNNFASSTFTPTVAGYYLFNVVVDFAITNSRQYYFQGYIYKNGSKVSEPEWTGAGNSGGRYTIAWSDIVYCNGSTDYIDIYAYVYDYTSSGSVTVRVESIFSGSLAGAA